MNAIASGYSDTDMTQQLDAEQREPIARRSGLKRMANSIDAARTNS